MSFLLLLLTASLAQASDPDANFCRNGGFPREQQHLQLGIIKAAPGERVHFFKDDEGCPSSDARCRQDSYLVGNDKVMVSKAQGDWACVWYQGRKHESVAWVPRANVALLPASPVRENDWIGTWRDGPDEIRIGRDGRALRLRSDLIWEGGSDSNGERIANVGGMDGTLSVKGHRGSAQGNDCEVQLTRIAGYLVVDDNGQCGGLNVRHTGVYRRVRR